MKICVCVAVAKTTPIGMANVEALNTLADGALIVNEVAELSPEQESRLVQVFDNLVTATDEPNDKYFYSAFKEGATAIIELSNEVFS